jgi:hypothetical protein
VAREADDAVRLRAWALLATGAGGVPVDAAGFKDWQGRTGASKRAAAMLLAALSGLGRAQGGDWAGLKADLVTPVNNRWTAAIAAAAARRAGGEVALLAATGLQGGWPDIPPAHLEVVLKALVASGHMAEARRLAAEAVTRTSGLVTDGA